MKLTKIVCCICKKICCWKLNMDIHRVVLGRSNEPHFFFKFWNVPECKVEMITRPTPALTTSDRLWLRQCQVSTHQTVSCHSVKITLFKNQKEKWSTIGWNLNSWSMKRTKNTSAFTINSMMSWTFFYLCKRSVQKVKKCYC